MEEEAGMRTFEPNAKIHENPRKYRFLNPRQIDMIDEALGNVGEYGEVRLVVEKGRLRFLVTQVSHDALLWQPGSLSDGLPRRPGSLGDDLPRQPGCSQDRS